MTTEEFKILMEAGIDAEKAISRLMGNEKIYLKYLFRFAEDQNYELLLRAFQRGDLSEAFRAVHTLKGTSSNVGVYSVSGIADYLTEELRDGHPGEIEDDILRLGNAFHIAQAAIRRIM